jgi:hypothetical protein
MAIAAEREALRAMLQRGEINDETFREILKEIVLFEAIAEHRDA